MGARATKHLAMGHRLSWAAAAAGHKPQGTGTRGEHTVGSCCQHDVSRAWSQIPSVIDL